MKNKPAHYRQISKAIRRSIVGMHTRSHTSHIGSAQSAKKTKAVFTIEEHSLIDGLGSAVCEPLAESKHRVLVKMFALPDIYGQLIGDRQYLLTQRGLLPAQIAEKTNSIVSDI